MVHDESECMDPRCPNPRCATEPGQALMDEWDQKAEADRQAQREEWERREADRG